MFPRSKNEHRYMSVRMGIRRMSTLRHSRLSSSALSVGGGGSVSSPPYANFSDLRDLRDSDGTFSMLAFSDIVSFVVRLVGAKCLLSSSLADPDVQALGLR